jgi:hypothetical protein
MTDTSVTSIYTAKIAWLIARHLLETSTFSHGIQLRATGDIFPELRVKAPDLEKLLRHDLPEMTECEVREYVVEITSPLSATEVMNRLRLADQPELPARTVKIVPTLFTSLIVFPCGFGVISDYCGFQFFRHSLRLENIEDEEQLRKAFWERINHTLPDPFYDGAEPTPKPLTTLVGSIDEMREILDALGAALSEETITKYYAKRSRTDFYIKAGRSKRSQPSVEYKGYTRANDLQQALRIISSYYHPIGTRIESKSSHHCHAGHRYSNFKLEPLSIEFTALDNPPARVRMAARGRIRRWFAEHAPENLELIDKLCGESSSIDEPDETSQVNVGFLHTLCEPAFGQAIPR